MLETTSPAEAEGAGQTNGVGRLVPAGTEAATSRCEAKCQLPAGK